MKVLLAASKKFLNDSYEKSAICLWIKVCFFGTHIYSVSTVSRKKKNIFVITYLPLFSAFPKSTKKHLIFIV